MSSDKLKVEIMGRPGSERGIPCFDLNIRDALSATLTTIQARELAHTLIAAADEAERGWSGVVTWGVTDSEADAEKLPMPAHGGCQPRGRLSGL
jgi:hypothetical protein